MYFFYLFYSIEYINFQNSCILQTLWIGLNLSLDPVFTRGCQTLPRFLHSHKHTPLTLYLLCAFHLRNNKSSEILPPLVIFAVVSKYFAFKDLSGTLTEHFRTDSLKCSAANCKAEKAERNTVDRYLEKGRVVGTRLLT